MADIPNFVGESSFAWQRVTSMTDSSNWRYQNAGTSDVELQVTSGGAPTQGGGERLVPGLWNEDVLSLGAGEEVWVRGYNVIIAIRVGA